VTATRTGRRVPRVARGTVGGVLAVVALVACGERETRGAERAAELMREEEAFRADSIATLAALTVDTVLVTWTMPDDAAADDGTGEVRTGTVHRYLSRSGLCLSTVARAAPGDTLRCPWHRPDAAEVEAVLGDSVPVTGVHPPIRPDAIAAETPRQYATRLLRGLQDGTLARPAVDTGVRVIVDSVPPAR
jgi:hypothetical protein